MSTHLEASTGGPGDMEFIALHLVDQFYPDAPHRCRTTDELSELDSTRLNALRVSEELLLLFEAVVVFCRVIDSEDEREAWLEHLGIFRDKETRSAANAVFKEIVAKVEAGSLGDLVDRINNEATRKFYRRLLGAAVYDRLTAAIADDFADILRAVKRLIAYLKPLMVGLEDAIQIIPAETIEKSDLAFLLSRSNLEMLTNLDAGIDQVITALTDRNFDFQVD